MTTKTDRPTESVTIADVKAAATGRWRDIAMSVGIPADCLGGDHGPCPRCKGTDRWRVFEDFNDTGGAYCNQCGKNLGGGFELLAWWKGCDILEAIKEVGDYCGLKFIPNGKSMNITATYDYQDENGTLLFQVCRLEPKDFRQRRPDGNGGWEWKTKGTRRVPYRLPQLLANPDRTVVVCEGEKDVHALEFIGVLATCNAGGAGKWRPDHAKHLQGRRVVVTPDRDEAGRKHGEQVANSLVGIAASIRVVELPRGKDAADWVAAGGTKDELLALAKAVEPWKPTASKKRTRTRTTTHGDNGACDTKAAAASSTPVVAVGMDEAEVAAEVLTALGSLGWNRESESWSRIYQRVGQLVHVTATADAAMCGVELPESMLRIRPLPAAIVRERIASAVKLEVLKGEDCDPIYIRPPAWLVNAIHQRGQYPRSIRPLTAIVRCPTLRPDGSVIDQPGYDAPTGLLFIPDGEYPPIPEAPTRDQSIQAAAELLDIVRDFPFKGAEHRSVWLAMVLTLVGRSAIRGPCPMFVIDANCPGTGKSMLTDVAGVIAYGDRLPRKPWPGNDDNEVRKTITSVALEGLAAVLWDNVGDSLGCSSLDAALTGTTWTDRLLGVNATTGALPLLTVWVATGNNIVLGADTARRILYCRIETDLDNPEERDDFQHENLVGWVRQNRHQLAVNAVTILRGYAHAGFPNQQLTPWGSYEAWSSLIRSAITWVGLPDPWETRTIVRQADHTVELLGLIHAGIDEADQTGDGVTSAQIVRLVGAPLEAGHEDQYPNLRAAIAEICGAKIDGRKVGNQLRLYLGRVKAGRRLCRQTAHGGGARWLIKSVERGCPGESGGSGDTVPSPSSNSKMDSSGSEKQEYEKWYGMPADSPDQPDSPSTWDCNHRDPTTWVVRDQRAYCPGCDRFMGYVRGVGA